eukprot:gene10213-11109_t
MSLPIDMVQKYKDLLAMHLLRVSGKPDHGDHSIPFLPAKGIALSMLSQIQDITTLGQLEKGYEILETVRDISLDSCNITDVSMMTKARSVELRNLSHLKDVSSLVHVKELTLVNCQEIEDISMLAGVVAKSLNYKDVKIFIQWN